MALTIGIDDAGRGPIIGPMILAGVLLDENAEALLKSQGVKDSKQVLHSTRVRLAELIKKSVNNFHVAITTPEQIDSSLVSGINLNTLEAIKTAEIINALNTEKDNIKVIVDCPSTNTVAWRETLLSYVNHKSNLDVRCEHKADANHVSASAASILAKVTREEEVARLKSEFSSHGNIGSGYPSDPDTKVFLKEQGMKLKDSGLFRKTWATWRDLYPQDSPALPINKSGSKNFNQKKLF